MMAAQIADRLAAQEQEIRRLNEEIGELLELGLSGTVSCEASPALEELRAENQKLKYRVGHLQRSLREEQARGSPEADSGALQGPSGPEVDNGEPEKHPDEDKKENSAGERTSGHQNKKKKEKKSVSEVNGLKPEVCGAPGFIADRLQLYETLKREHDALLADRAANQSRPIKITLANGNVVEVESWRTTPFQVAAGISRGLADNTVIAKVNNELWDLDRPLEEDVMLAQALVSQHLGRDWRWEKHKKQPEAYRQILHFFLDRKDCCYSIHQMAQMGIGEGKSIGEWFGPNTVAQVLKKLALFDEWNSLAVYVSMDNTVVIEDIKKMCRYHPESCSMAHCSSYTHQSAPSRCREASTQSSGWRPLLLIVPLRLGINHINPVYVEAFKECFKMPQSLGALGGKPNNAYYFIGFSGDELIYLDPHTTQMFVDAEEAGTVQDETYHCQKSPNRMKILNLDPSVALGFFCKEEKDFDNWCSVVEKEILKKQSLRMFELAPKHPPHWPPFIPPTKPEVSTTGAELIESTDKLFDVEEEFEILSV